MVEKKVFTKTETFWWLLRRFARTVIPQIPALLSGLEVLFPKTWLPVLVAVGGVLTVLDKCFRDMRVY